MIDMVDVESSLAVGDEEVCSPPMSPRCLSFSSCTGFPSVSSTTFHKNGNGSHNHHHPTDNNTTTKHFRAGHHPPRVMGLIASVCCWSPRLEDEEECTSATTMGITEQGTTSPTTYRSSSSNSQEEDGGMSSGGGSPLYEGYHPFGDTHRTTTTSTTVSPSQQQHYSYDTQSSDVVVIVNGNDVDVKVMLMDAADTFLTQRYHNIRAIHSQRQVDDEDEEGDGVPSVMIAANEEEEDGGDDLEVAGVTAEGELLYRRCRPWPTTTDGGKRTKPTEEARQPPPRPSSTAMIPTAAALLINEATTTTAETATETQTVVEGLECPAVRSVLPMVMDTLVETERLIQHHHWEDACAYEQTVTQLQGPYYKGGAGESRKSGGGRPSSSALWMFTPSQQQHVRQLQLRARDRENDPYAPYVAAELKQWLGYRDVCAVQAQMMRLSAEPVECLR